MSTVNRRVLEQDGLTFKDIDGTGTLSPVNDWRNSPAERAAAYVKTLSVKEKIAQLFISDWRLASTGAIRRMMAEHPSEFDPRKFFAKTIDAMRDICIARYEAFGTAGNASKIKPISLEGMFKRYASGELAAKVN